MAERRNLIEENCRSDVPRCFDRLEWDPDRRSVYAYFHDGSEYEYFGLSEAEATEWINRLHPGCWFNAHIWPGAFIKHRGPN